MEVHNERIAKERFRARLSAALINIVLSFYGLWLVLYLVTGSFTGVGKDVQGLFGLSHKQTLLSLLPLSLVLGVLWSLRAASPAACGASAPTRCSRASCPTSRAPGCACRPPGW
ncbi:MAG: hypothetical protein R3F17_11485 [Planctomycetota bacterium]